MTDIVDELEKYQGDAGEQKRIRTDAATEIRQLRTDNARLREALGEIKDHEWVQYRVSSEYGHGVTDGHRACAKIARRALSDAPKESES